MQKFPVCPGVVVAVLMVGMIALAETPRSLEVGDNPKLLCDPHIDVRQLTFNGAKLGGKVEDIKGREKPDLGTYEEALKSGEIQVKSLNFSFDKKNHVITSVTLPSRARGEMQDIQSIAAAQALFGKADEIKPGEDDPETKHLIYKKRGLDVFLDKERFDSTTLKLYSITVSLPQAGK